jgi:indole-3-glycerol phosphate synthase
MKLSEGIIHAKRRGQIPIIAEVKLRTPRDGDLLRGRDPVKLAKKMADAGAVGISVVTEPLYFGGSMDLLQKIRETISLPLLRKDFVSSVHQILESKKAGADALLLIVRKLDNAKLMELYSACIRVGIEPLVEVHDSVDLQRAISLGAKLIGINNRDIQRLETDNGDVATTEQLLREFDKNSLGALVISESSIQTRDHVLRAIKAGADAVLVGTALMKAQDVTKKLHELMGIGQG